MADIEVDLPAERDQINTRRDPRFVELRTQVYEHIQAAKRGYRPDEAEQKEAVG